jgi:hypothetical protein
LLGFTVGGMTYSNLQAASSASNYSASRDPAYYWPGADENANEPSNGGDAIANLEVLDGGLNIATVDLGFDTTLDSSRRLFMIEVTGNDEIEVQGFLDGSPVGSVLTIQSGDWGSDLDLDPGRAGIEKAKVFIQYGTDRNNGTEQPMAGVSFLVSDLGAASINGIRIIDNEGPASFDPAVVGYVVPEPATMSLLAIGGLGALIRRRRG